LFSRRLTFDHQFPTSGPGCSSIGYGAASELGPLRVDSQGAELKFNEYGWNKGVHACFLNLWFFFMLKVSYICLKNDAKSFFVLARG